MAAVLLAARGGARYASNAPRLFAAAAEHREQLRNDLALQTAEDVTATLGTMKGVLLADLFLRAGAGPARPPSKATIWRVITDADPEVFDAAAGRWLTGGRPDSGEDGASQDKAAELVPVRLDGKTVRGARDAAGNQRHLLAAMVGSAAVLGGRGSGRGRGQDE